MPKIKKEQTEPAAPPPAGEERNGDLSYWIIPWWTPDPPTRTVSYSEMDSFRQCGLKWWLSYRQGWQKPSEEGSALSVGTVWHDVLEAHYNLLKHIPAGARDLKGGEWVKARITEEKIDTIDSDEERELVKWMYDGHIEQWGLDPQWEILEVETEGQVPLADGFEFRFKLDLLVRDVNTGRYHVVDHKTVHDFTRDVEIELDDQFSLYVHALRESGVPVFSAIKSEARKRRLKGDKTGEDPTPVGQRFKRTELYRTDVETLNCWNDLVLTAQTAYGDAYPADRAPHSSPNPQQCSWRCSLLEPHIAMRKGIPMERALKSHGFERKERYRGSLDNPS